MTDSPFFHWASRPSQCPHAPWENEKNGLACNSLPKSKKLVRIPHDPGVAKSHKLEDAAFLACRCCAVIGYFRQLFAHCPSFPEIGAWVHATGLREVEIFSTKYWALDQDQYLQQIVEAYRRLHS